MFRPCCVLWRGMCDGCRLIVAVRVRTPVASGGRLHALAAGAIHLRREDDAHRAA